MVLLLHKTALVNFPMATTVYTSHQIASLSSYTATIDSLRVYQQIFLWSASRKNPCPKSGAKPAGGSDRANKSAWGFYDMTCTLIVFTNFPIDIN